MSTVPFNEAPHGNGGLIQISSKEELIRQKLEDERRRLEKEAGLEKRAVQQFHKPIERAFTKSQRDHTTILFGGLTWKHEKLIHGALEGLGYKCEAVPVPNKRAFQLGKEYGNNGQCNPTYFTVGNLVQFAQSLEEKGLTKQEIIDRYVFFTAGACGPCRFGMYEAEYRLALRNAGFDGFRVLLFQQSGGLNQAEAEAGLEMNLDFFLNILNAMNIGDVINDVAYQIRPFEVNPGETDRVLDECMDMLQEVMRRKRPWTLEGKLASLLSKTNFAGTAEYLGKFLNQLYGDDYTAALNEVRDRFNAIPLDRTRVKPHREDHRRILGANHRGRRQLQHVQVPGKGRRAGPGGAHRHLDHVHDSPGQAADPRPARVGSGPEKRPQVEPEGDFRQPLEYAAAAGQADRGGRDLQARIPPLD